MSTPPARLYGQPGDETLRSELMDVWELSIEPLLDDDNLGPWIIEEWSVTDPATQIPDAATVVEWIEEHTSDTGVFTDDPWQHGRPSNNPEIIEVAQRLVDLIAAEVSWFQADTKMAEHILELPDNNPDNKPTQRKL